MQRMHKVHQNSNLRPVAVAALVGGLAGAAVGLMFAPKSGKELRHGLYKKADNALEHVEDVTSLHTGALKQQGSNLVDKGKQLAEDLQTFIQESLKQKKAAIFPLILPKIYQHKHPSKTNLKWILKDLFKRKSRFKKNNIRGTIPRAPYLFVPFKKEVPDDGLVVRGFLFPTANVIP